MIILKTCPIHDKLTKDLIYIKNKYIRCKKCRTDSARKYYRNHKSECLVRGKKARQKNKEISKLKESGLIQSKRTILTLSCWYCDKQFKRSLRYIKDKKNKGVKNFFCGRVCVYDSMRNLT
jgi:hypothetical protein